MCCLIPHFDISIMSFHERGMLNYMNGHDSGVGCTEKNYVELTARGYGNLLLGGKENILPLNKHVRNKFLS